MYNLVQQRMREQVLTALAHRSRAESADAQELLMSDFGTLAAVHNFPRRRSKAMIGLGSECSMIQIDMHVRYNSWPVVIVSARETTARKRPLR